MTWYGAARYCDWLSMQADLPRAYAHSGDWACNGGDPYGAAGYRLPTDAEWEFATQYDGERLYPWGDEVPDCSRVNSRINGYVCIGFTTPVGSYPGAPSSLGLYDMAGNIWEWCNDWHVCDLGTSPVTDPTGPGGGTDRVLRGSSWNHHDTTLPCAYRFHENPDGNDSFFGFRVARTAR